MLLVPRECHPAHSLSSPLIIMMQVVLVPLDLSCVTAALTHRLADMFTDTELDGVQAPQL